MLPPLASFHPLALGSNVLREAFTDDHLTCPRPLSLSLPLPLILFHSASPSEVGFLVYLFLDVLTLLSISSVSVGTMFVSGLFATIIPVFGTS